MSPQDGIIANSQKQEQEQDAHVPFQFGCNRFPLHHACRIQSFQQVEYLVKVLKYNVNTVDDFDASPLYLAALVGSMEICKFLLQNGATCSSSHDAARVFYVALTPQLQSMLREWSVTAATRNVFLENMRSSFHNVHVDCVVHVGVEQVHHVHACMLQATCRKLFALIQPNDDDDDIVFQLHFPNEYKSDAVKLVLEYLYTGILETRDLQMARVVSRNGKFIQSRDTSTRY